MKTTFFAVALALFTIQPASAQNQDLGEAVGQAGPVEDIPIEGSGTAETDGPLRGTVTDESQLDDLQLAIPAFAAERDVATAANARGTAALGAELAQAAGLGWVAAAMQDLLWEAKRFGRDVARYDFFRGPQGYCALGESRGDTFQPGFEGCGDDEAEPLP